MTNLNKSLASPVALILLLTGLSGAQEQTPGLAQVGDKPARAQVVDDFEVSGYQTLDFGKQALHPGPDVVVAILPTFQEGASRELLLQGGEPGGVVRVDFGVNLAGKTVGLTPVGWASFDGSGQARVSLGPGPHPEGQLQCWLATTGGSWWPGPQMSFSRTTSADAALVQQRPVQTGELLISEVMKDPSAVSDTSGEWVELFNTTWMRQDIEGYTLTDDAGGGTVLTNGGNHVWVVGRGYRVLARNADSGSNGGVVGAHDYGTFSLRNGADQVILAKPDGTVVDRISYDDGILWPDSSGSSMQLRPGIESPYLNDSGIFWCESSSSFGLGNLGTPGYAHDDC